MTTDTTTPAMSETDPNPTLESARFRADINALGRSICVKVAPGTPGSSGDGLYFWAAFEADIGMWDAPWRLDGAATPLDALQDGIEYVMDELASELEDVRD